MKRLWLALVGIIIVICIGFILYSKTYTISNSRTQLIDNILLFINRPKVVANNIDIKQELDIDNKKYVLFIINGKLGDAELTKGFNNKYKIESTGYGSAFFRNEIKKTNKSKYIILKGKNPNNNIAYSKVILDNVEYKIVIPQQEYFMVYCEVPIDTEKVILDHNNIKFYSSNDVDIATNILQAKAEKENIEQEVSISNNNDWPTFTDKEVEEAKEVAKAYYKHIKLPHDIESINYNMSNDEKDEIYKSFIGRDTSKYKNRNSIFFLIHTKDEDGCEQSRFILLTREDKDSNWKVVNEGL